MSDPINAHPLTWPPTIPRRKAAREAGAFKTSLAGALKNVQDSLCKFGTDSGQPIRDLVLSSNCSLGVDRPADPGVAAWFTWDGEQRCIPIDRYATPAANLQAIHLIVEARRVELRHGTLALVRATFHGLKALPAPKGSDWWAVLGCEQTATLDQARDAYRKAASAAHLARLAHGAGRQGDRACARERGMKERELRQHATCSLCNKRIGHTGLPLFWRVTVERFGIDMAAVKRQQGLGLMLGASLAAVMGPDEDIAKPMMEPVTLTVCETCAVDRDHPVAAMAELGEPAKERSDA